MGELDPIGAILGFLGLGTSINNMEMQAEMARENREWQEKMINQARDWEVKRWNATNQYNSPLQQMQRYSEAGLNPNLIYSQGTPGLAGQLNTSAPSSNQSAPQFDMSPLLQAAQYANQAKQTSSNIRLQDTQAEFQKAATQTEMIRQATELARSRHIDAQAKGQAIANTLAQAIQPEQIDQARLTTDIMIWQRSISRLSAKEKQFNVDTILPLEQLKLQIDNEAKKAGIRLTQAQISNLAASTQKLVMEGKILSLQYEYDKVLREYGISPDTPGWFKSAVHPFFWQNVVGPVYKGVKSLFNGSFGDPTKGMIPTEDGWMSPGDYQFEQDSTAWDNYIKEKRLRYGR